MICTACGGSGARVDELERKGEEITPEIREMLDDNRCQKCNGSGETPIERQQQALRLQRRMEDHEYDEWLQGA